MRAAVLHGPQDLRDQDVAEPAAPGAHEVTIAVHLCGVCGTDAHEWAHGGPMTPLTVAHPNSGHVGPTVIGHEFMGTVVAAGADAVLPVGQRVVAGAGQWCGDCPACAAGRTNLCERYFTYGLSTHGGMAERITVPEAMCVAVPDGCDDANAVLAQPVAIAMHAVDRSGIEPGSEILVIGAGGIGALLVACAADLGAKVTVVDLDPARLDAAVRLGASTVEVVEADRPGAAVTGVATVFETSGSTSGLRMAMASVARGGRIVGVGLPSRPVEFDSRQAVVSEIDVVTSSAHVCRRDLPKAVDLLTRRPLSREIVAQTVPIDRIVIDALAPMAAGAIKGKSVVDVRRVSQP
jgi:(R,R)-butanediol dehydrogenase/meso-butanediol dehydrogenase/diacetyl reductase